MFVLDKRLLMMDKVRMYNFTLKRKDKMDDTRGLLCLIKKGDGNNKKNFDITLEHCNYPGK